MDYVGLFTLLARWLYQDDRFDGFLFTSITINKNHDAYPHRDVGNAGNSIIRGLGEYDGGRLFWFPHDRGDVNPDSLDMSEAEYLDITDFTCFDGQCVHGVEPFTGERITVIFFTTITSADDEAEANIRLLRSWQGI